MMDLTDVQTIHRLAKQSGFSFSKGLGQNFIIDPTVCPAIAAAGVPDHACGVLEVGPGFGVLTRELAQSAAMVRAVEIDRRLEPVLKETLADCPQTAVVWADFLTLDLPQFLQQKFGERRVAFCANLPYYITSPIVMRVLESGAPFTSVTVMVQREAAERLCAAVGTRAAGAVTVAVRLRGTAEQLFDVPREAFYPAPKVDSAVIRITPYATPLCTAAEQADLLEMVKAGFAQRRKTACNGLSAGMGLSKEQVREALTACQLSENVRFEQLDLDTLRLLSRTLRAIRTSA